MTAKEYLQQIYRLNELIEHDQREIELLRALITNVSAPNTENERVNGGIDNHDKIGDIIANIDEYERKLNNEIDRYVDLRNEVHGKIMKVKNNDARLILFYRYMEFMKWEEIAVTMHYTFQWVHVLHKRALQDFEKILNS